MQKKVGKCVVGHENIGEAVVIVVGKGNTHPLAHIL